MHFSRSFSADRRRSAVSGETAVGARGWAHGYLAVSSGAITDEMIREYIDEQEGEQIADDSRFPIECP